MTGIDLDLPRLHIRPASGWLNDPNGVGLVDGVYHVFFQFNPAAPVHGDIHWGHVTSRDLLHWDEQPVALAPRAGGVDGVGCWSGSMLIDDGVPTLLYTAVASEPGSAGVVRATPTDPELRSWSAGERLIPGSADPAELEVRDPVVFTLGGHRYAAQGAGARGGSGRIEVYACDDLNHWESRGVLLDGTDPVAATLGPSNIWECPNLFALDGRWVLLYSVWRDATGPVREDAVAWLVGDLDDTADGPRFRPERAGFLDAGTTFYAPQVMSDGTRSLMWGWLREPEGDTHAEEAGWSGALSLPQELFIDRAGALRARPAGELIGLRRAEISPDAGGAIAASAFEVDGRTAAVELWLGDEQVFVHRGDPVSLRIFVDGSVVEAFVDGRATYSTRAYPSDGGAWRLIGGEGTQLWELGAD